MMRDSWSAAIWSCLALGLLASNGCEGKHSALKPTDPTLAVLEWARAQGLSNGSSQELRLPSELATASVTGTVYAARTLDGRTCVLLKAHLGFKDNFEGKLRLDGPPRASELIDTAPRPYVSLAGLPPFEELFVRTRLGADTFVVYFDLN